MEVVADDNQGVATSDAATKMVSEKRLYKSDLGRDAEMFPRRLEWISVVLFIVNFFLMVYSYSIYEEYEAWGLTMTAISTVTGVLFLFSITFSIFGFKKLSQFALGIGLIGMMASVVSLGVRLMQMLSEYHSYY